jgi:hypothetical protein
MIDYEFALRAAAVVAAVTLVAAPGVVAYAQTAFAWLWAKRQAVAAKPSPSADDAHTVVEIARRLQAAGNKRGVELCQQILDVLLMPEGAKK